MTHFISQRYKVVFMGETGVGKSSIVLRFIKDYWETNVESTIGAVFMTKTINVNNQAIKLDLWDTAGQERYHSLAPIYYRCSDAIVIVYDITNPSSYERAKEWLKEIRHNYKQTIPPVIYFVGNKIDLDGQRKISVELASEYATRHELGFTEVSAKTGKGVTDLFQEVTDRIIKNIQKHKDEKKIDDQRPIDLYPPYDQNQSYYRCCWW